MLWLPAGRPVCDAFQLCICTERHPTSCASLHQSTQGHQRHHPHHTSHNWPEVYANLRSPGWKQACTKRVVMPFIPAVYAARNCLPLHAEQRNL